MRFKSSSKGKYALFHWDETLHLSYTYVKIQTSNPVEKSIIIKILLDQQVGHVNILAMYFLPAAPGWTGLSRLQH